MNCISKRKVVNMIPPVATVLKNLKITYNENHGSNVPLQSETICRITAAINGLRRPNLEPGIIYKFVEFSSLNSNLILWGFLSQRSYYFLIHSMNKYYKKSTYPTDTRIKCSPPESLL